jgi:hypothetical protein
MKPSPAHLATLGPACHAHRTPRTARALAGALLFAGLSVSFPAAGGGLRTSGDLPPLPKAEDVVRRIIDRAKNAEVRRAKASYTYSQHSVIEKLDEKNRTREREERIYEVGPVEGRSYARLVKKNGQPLAGEDLRLEKERERRFIERHNEQRLGASDEDRVPLDAELFDRYRGNITGRETIAGRSALVLEFSPKSRDLPVRRRQDYVLNKLGGKVWVDEQDYEIVKVEAHLLERVRVFLGLVASVDKVDIDFTQTRVSEVVYLPQQLHFYIDGRKLFTLLHQRMQADWSDYRPAAGNHPATKN